MRTQCTEKCGTLMRSDHGPGATSSPSVDLSPTLMSSFYPSAILSPTLMSPPPPNIVKVQTVLGASDFFKIAHEL